MLDLAYETLEVLQSEYPLSAKPGISPIPLFQDLFLGPNTSSVNMDDFPITRNESDDIMLYLHSSGNHCLAISIAND
jgi:hypothetical protein